MTMDELRFLDWIRQSDRPEVDIELGVGDDGAVFRCGGESMVIVADTVAEGTHFVADEDPRLVGRKALAVNLSDVAAMGAAPLCAVATATLPHGVDERRAQGMVEGMRALGAETGCPLVGGDTVTHDGPTVLSVTVVGRVLGEEPIRRTGAAPGYCLAVTGAIGGSLAGRHLTFQPRLAEARCFVDSRARMAMIDVSDGLLLDLCRLTDGLGFRIHGDRVPLHVDAGGLDAALEAGEDFELLAAIHPEDLPTVRESWAVETPLTVIGEVVDDGRVLVVGEEERVVRPRGYVHG